MDNYRMSVFVRTPLFKERKKKIVHSRDLANEGSVDEGAEDESPGSANVNRCKCEQFNVYLKK
jgi:hypothetical protein